MDKLMRILAKMQIEQSVYVAELESALIELHLEQHSELDGLREYLR
jgi:hypothetical protein